MNESIDKYQLLTSSIATSSGFCDDNHPTNIDEDVLNYLSTLTPNQQRMLDDFVSFNDHPSLNLQTQSKLSSICETQPQIQQSPAVLTFAYGNSVGANNYFGRPMSMYEPYETQIDQEFSSLPPDLVSSTDPNSCIEIDPVYLQKFSYEAEDAEYIETLNEMRENFESETNDRHKVTCVADVHYDNSNLYATVQKPKKHQSLMMIASSESTSAPPLEKFPKIMTQSCYGQLNNPNDYSIWNSYEQDLIDEDGSNHQIISSLMTTTTTDSSIIDGISSINSSIYEQIPSMTSSIETAMTTATTRQRKIVKWWDDHAEHTEESLQNLHETAEEGECLIIMKLKTFFKVDNRRDDKFYILRTGFYYVVRAIVVDSCLVLQRITKCSCYNLEHYGCD